MAHAINQWNAIGRAMTIGSKLVDVGRRSRLGTVLSNGVDISEQDLESWAEENVRDEISGPMVHEVPIHERARNYFRRLDPVLDIYNKPVVSESDALSDVVASMHELIDEFVDESGNDLVSEFRPAIDEIDELDEFYGYDEWLEDELSYGQYLEDDFAGGVYDDLDEFEGWSDEPEASEDELEEDEIEIHFEVRFLEYDWDELDFFDRYVLDTENHAMAIALHTYRTDYSRNAVHQSWKHSKNRRQQHREVQGTAGREFARDWIEKEIPFQLAAESFGGILEERIFEFAAEGLYSFASNHLNRLDGWDLEFLELEDETANARNAFEQSLLAYYRERPSCDVQDEPSELEKWHTSIVIGMRVAS